MAAGAWKAVSARTNPSVPLLIASTCELDTREGHAVWARAIGDTYCEMDLTLGDPRRRFAGELSGRQIGDLHVSQMRSDAHAVLRTPAMIHSDPRDDYLVCLLTSGEADVRQDDRVCHLTGGSFTVVDCTRPFAFRLPIGFEQVVVRVPHVVLDKRLPARTLATARAVTACSGAGSVVGGVIRQLAALDQDLSPATAGSFSSAALDMLVSTLVDNAVQLTPTEQARMRDLRRAQHALRAGMGGPERSIAEVAQSIGMSVRHMQNLFAEAQTTPSAWLQEARLDRAAVLLLSSRLTVAEICEAVGFRDVSHFSRCFRRRFGTSPARYRGTGHQPGSSPALLTPGG